jgi:uncharacterized protein (TIGR02266 family)
VHTSKRVIVADDTAFVRDRFSKALSGAGHTPVAVKSAAELLAHVRESPEEIDLVVMDLRLPNSGGVDMVRALRRIDQAKRVTLLVFSGTISTADEVRDLATLGVAGYVNEYSAADKILPALAPHLFPDSFNRRSSPRVLLSIPVSCTYENTIAALVTFNISKGGLAIRTMTPWAQGSKVKVRFRLPGGKQEIHAESRVAWSDRRIGMGVQFEKVDPQGQTAIDEFVDHHFFTNRRA